MASQAEINSFHNTWNQTAGWAQQKGIKYNDYFPIYQQDTQRLMAGQPTMSQAERERAIQAASNPNALTQATPSTASNPGNVIGNTITDARDIFTGLTGIVSHPLHNALVDSVKNTFDLAIDPHRLKGMSLSQKLSYELNQTVLSWIPGISDVGTLIGSGPGALAEHPLSSILDVLPLANKAVGLKVASDAGFAERTGLTDPNMVKPSIGRAVKGYILRSETGTVGPEGPMTIGDRLSQFTGHSFINANHAIADGAKGIELTNSHATAMERYFYNDYETIAEDMTDEQHQQLEQLFDTSTPSNFEKRLEDPYLDPKVKQAADAIIDGPMRHKEEEDIALADGPTKVINPRTGQVEVRSTSGKGKVVYRTREAYKEATAKVLESGLPELETQGRNTQLAESLFQRASAGLGSTLQNARQVHVDSSQFTFKPHEAQAKTRLVRAVKRVTPIKYGIEHSTIAEKMFGTGGFLDKLLAKAQEGRYEDVQFLAAAALKRLDKWGINSVDAADDTAFIAVRDQVDKLEKTARALLHVRAKSEREIYGAAEEWAGGKGARDAFHEEERKQIAAGHREELRQFGQARKQAFASLHRVWSLNKEHIRQNAADAKRAADAYVRDQTRNITERFELEKAKVQNKHLLAREAHAEWVRGRRAQGLPGPSDPTLAAQEGTRIAPGALGSREAILREQDALEAGKQKALRDMEAQAPNKAAIDAKMQADLRDADKAEGMMVTKLKTQWDADGKDLTDAQQKAAKDYEKTQVGKKSRDGKTSKLFKDWMKTQKEFSDAVWKHPSDNKVDLFFNLLTKHLLANEEATRALAKSEKSLAREFDWSEKSIEQYRANPALMRDIVTLAVRGVFSDALKGGLDKAIVDDIRTSALDELDELGKQGIFPPYVPHVSETQMRADATGSYGIHTVVGKVPKPDALSSRAWDLDHSKYDLMAGLHRGTKQTLDLAAIKDYAKKYLAPHVITRDSLRSNVMTYFQDDLTQLSKQGIEDFVTARIDDWHLEKFNPSKYGYRDPAWGDQDVYINKDLIRALKKLTNNGTGLPSKTILDKTTKLFRYSILGLSPRYTAHIVAGGTMLLALQEPLFFLYIPEVFRNMKAGHEPEALSTVSTNMGTTEYELSSPAKAVRAVNHAGGKQSGHMVLRENIEKVQGIARGAEKPIHWLRAMADVNLHFTSYVTHFQRSIAFTAGKARAERRLTYTENGHTYEMTEERAVAEGLHNAERVMGDLRTMSPFERQVARSIMPFYGWQKHILTYVMTFPADHPWRAMMLANMAELNTEMNPGGLPSRYQFLFFLGQPDAQGNATVEDFRQINPLRDVANYATWQGFFGSLNPAISGPLAMVDPSIIYGGNQLYPNVTYDQFYGIEEAGPQGNLLTGATQIVPELGALQTALKAAGTRQGLSGQALVKNIAESLNFPWVPQHINLKQEAAKTAIAQYQTTKNLASQAWQTGDFGPIQDLGSVPDPRNADYETPVSELEQMYSELAKQYPGIPPDQTATPLPSAPL